MKTTLKNVILAIVAMTAGTVATAGQEGLKVFPLSESNTMVRITDPTQKYLILPVEDRVPDAKIDVLVNGDIVQSLQVKLACNEIDYTVPLDLTPYTSKGNVVLNIVNPIDRSYSRDAQDFICWEEMKLSDSFDTTNKEKYRPLFHHTPLYGWMNDPNGMFYKDGTWHLYYQHNPYGSRWQNLSWGHSTSRDLINWEHEPEAILPNGLGYIFSGSAVIDSCNTGGFGDDAVVAFFTSAATSQVQSMAVSKDGGETFTNYSGNPVIPNTHEARDPKVFWHEGTQRWIMLLAAALNHEMEIHSSPDLVNWTYESSFGRGYGGQDGVWECPDLIKLPIKGSKKEKWVLICNINPGGPFGGSAAQYFVGDFDGHKFTCDNAVNETRWMDYGKDHYATVTWYNAPDNRTVALGWMSNWQYANEVPTMQFRSANTLPRDLSLFRAPDGDLYLSVVPSPEVNAMRGTKESHQPFTLTDSVSYTLPIANDGVCEIDLGYNLKDAKGLSIILSNANGEKVTMKYDPRKHTFLMDRQESGLTKFSRHFPTTTVAPTLSRTSKGTLRLFIDRCSIEAFDGDGNFAMTNLVFPKDPYTTLTLVSDGGKTRIDTLDIYPLDPSLALN